MKLKKVYVIKILIFLNLFATIFTANARPWHRGDIHHFERHDRHVWRGGHWAHTHYSGRIGWWWIVGPSWYYYPKPVYPYPDPYTPPANQIVIQPPTQSWYFCESSKEYYPYISSCPEGWKVVPVTPDKKP